MSEYRIFFVAGSSAAITVEADSYDDAVDEAYDAISEVTVCAQCSGWGQSWSRDDGEWELDEESGHEVDGKYVAYKAVQA